jgi:hypothetical protein
MKVMNVLIVALTLFSCIATAQDTIYTHVKSESVKLPVNSDYYRVATRDSLSKKRIVNEYAVIRIQKSQLVTKKGESILPDEGDWAISIDATPFLQYFGNFIGSNGVNAAPTMNFLSGNQTITGKYFVSPEKAYRLGIRLGFSSNSTTTKETTLPSSTPVVYVNDVSTLYNTNIGLTAGMEWRRGKTRLQGYYGVEGGLAIGTSSTNNTFGNNLSPYNLYNRIDENNEGSSVGLGVRGFIGVEYFIFPKIAFGGELGWGIAFRTVGEGSTKSEYWDTTTRSVISSIVPTGGSTFFGFDSDNLNSIFGQAGSIRLTFHF